MARRFEYFFRETTAGLSRNWLVAFAAIATSFIALLLLGLALLTQREVNLIVDATGGKVEVSVFLQDGISAAQQDALQTKIRNIPVVSSVTYESQDQACAKAKVLFKDEPDLIANLDCTALPASFKVKLTDPEKFSVVAAQLPPGTPGVESVRDQHAVLDRVFTVTGVFRGGILGVAILMLISAAILIANTVRLGLFARRKEIGIMKLVGATNWFIRVPFLIEGIFEGLFGAILAIVVLMILKRAFINPLYGKIVFFPWVQTSDVLALIPILLGTSILVALIAGLLGMRRFLDV